MKERSLWLTLTLLALGAWAAWGNVPPSLADMEVHTVQGVPITLEVRAQDQDIDPLDPTAHPLRFVLLEGPAHGVLVGDLEDVHYEAPYDAVVELTYVPAGRFVGVDHVTLAVFDPHGAMATGTIRIDVVKRVLEGTFSGTWSLGLTWVPETNDVSAFATELSGVYRVGTLTVRGIADLRKMLHGGVEQITFDAFRLVSDFRPEGMRVASTLAFDPKSASDLFDYWRSSLSFELAELSFAYTFFLTDPLASSYHTLVTRGSADPFRFTNTLRYDMDAAGGLQFARNTTSVSWTWCDLALSANLAFTKDGFRSLGVSLSGLPLEAYLPGVYAGVNITYAVDAKTVSATLRWIPLVDGCIRLFGGPEEYGGDSLSLGAIMIYGLRLECDIAGARFVSATSLDPARNSILTGQTDYWHVFRLSGTLMGCCGVPGTWGLSTYFYADSTMLFGWGMTTAALEAAVSKELTGRIRLVLRSGELGDPTVEISFGFVLRV